MTRVNIPAHDFPDPPAARTYTTATVTGSGSVPLLLAPSVGGPTTGGAIIDGVTVWCVRIGANNEFLFSLKLRIGTPGYSGGDPEIQQGAAVSVTGSTVITFAIKPNVVVPPGAVVYLTIDGEGNVTNSILVETRWRKHG